jgi:predicted nucleic acid-binding protein
VNYLLDTNVVSEMMKNRADGSVLAWMDGNQDSCFVSSVTVAEIEKGIEMLPEGQRKRDLQKAFREFLPDFEDKVLSFDLRAARKWAKLAVELRRQGRQTPVMDSMIEATALLWKLVVVTRNTSDFIQAATLNPWTMPA